MKKIVGVRFKKAGKVYYFNPGYLDIKQNQQVIVETARGMELGVAVIPPREVEDDEVKEPLVVVQRIANEGDIQRRKENEQREKEAYVICEKKIAEHQLDMKLVNVEYTLDMNKIVFYFTAEGRIDFRELVKDLASVFRTRIELRQIGVRDEAKLIGGIGCCGRPLCCATFLGDFAPVSIRMAKEQNLSLNPTKISGICGRLMCCLKYESECYNDFCPKKKVQPPAQGGRVASIEGEGKVISVNMQRRNATILLDNRKTIVASWEDIVEQEETTEATAAANSAGDEGQAANEAVSQTANDGEGQAAAEGERRERPQRGNRRNNRRNDGDEGGRRHSEGREGYQRHSEGGERGNRRSNGSEKNDRRYDYGDNGGGNGEDNNHRHRTRNGGYGDNPFGQEAKEGEHRREHRRRDWGDRRNGKRNSDSNKEQGGYSEAGNEANNSAASNQAQQPSADNQ